MKQKSFSYAAERKYYSRSWPRHAAPFQHLEPYLRCWMDPNAVFRGKRVLDIGAGECAYTRLIAERFAPLQIIASELFAERMLPSARESRERSLSFVVGNCLALPFRDASFDVVFAAGVLTQLPDLDESIREIRRVLNVRGTFVGWEPNPFNPGIVARYFLKKHSANQYLFWPHLFRPAFERNGLRVSARYFYAKYPRMRSRFVGTCIGLMAVVKQD